MATKNPAVIGLKDVLKNMGDTKKSLAPKVELGLKTAGLYLQGKSQYLVPVDTGNLKASAFTRAEGGGFQTVVNIGYMALYAMWVHENVEMKLRGQPRPAPHKGNYWDPAGRGQSKFLEAPARDTAVRAAMVKIFKNVCKTGDQKGASA